MNVFVYVYLCDHLPCHENLSTQVHWTTLLKRNDPYECIWINQWYKLHCNFAKCNVFLSDSLTRSLSLSLPLSHADILCKSMFISRDYDWEPFNQIAQFIHIQPSSHCEFSQSQMTTQLNWFNPPHLSIII